MQQLYSFCVFSPSGKLVQIEYALAAVASGGPSVGIKGWLFLWLFGLLLMAFFRLISITSACRNM